MSKIIVDSACDISLKLKEDFALNIDTVPLSLQIDQKEYIDDQNLDIDSYLKDMEAFNGAPKSAAPSPQAFLEKYQGSNEDSLFVLTMSSKLSSTYNSAVIAKDMYDENGENSPKFIHIFDSFSASVGETVIALKINETIKRGLPNDETVVEINSFIENHKIYFILEKFDNLVKSGRLNPYVAKIASMLSIKPICHGDKGEMALLDKARGFNKAVEKLIDLISKENIDFENRILGISHVKAPEKAQQVREAIMKRLAFKDSIIVETSGLCTTYADKGGIIIAL